MQLENAVVQIECRLSVFDSTCLKEKREMTVLFFTTAYATCNDYYYKYRQYKI